MMIADLLFMAFNIDSAQIFSEHSQSRSENASYAKLELIEALKIPAPD